jgi:hypothetical protein
LQFIRPCSSTTAKTVPASEAWLHEPKLDGYRLQVIKEGSHLLLYSRRGIVRLPALAAALAAIPCSSAVIDAELCLPDAIEAHEPAPAGRSGGKGLAAEPTSLLLSVDSNLGLNSHCTEPRKMRHRAGHKIRIARSAQKDRIRPGLDARSEPRQADRCPQD